MVYSIFYQILGIIGIRLASLGIVRIYNFKAYGLSSLAFGVGTIAASFILVMKIEHPSKFKDELEKIVLKRNGFIEKFKEFKYLEKHDKVALSITEEDKTNFANLGFADRPEHIVRIQTHCVINDNRKESTDPVRIENKCVIDNIKKINDQYGPWLVFFRQVNKCDKIPDGFKEHIFNMINFCDRPLPYSMFGVSNGEGTRGGYIISTERINSKRVIEYAEFGKKPIVLRTIVDCKNFLRNYYNIHM